MRVVSIGDLVVDYYYMDEKLIGINGGMTVHNIIVNLAHFKINTAVFGAVGNDTAGQIAIKSLKDLKVDVSNIKIIDNVKTRLFHVSYFKNKPFTSKKRCPFCTNKSWYDESLIDTQDIIKNLKEEDILIFDNLNNKNQFIIDNTSNKKIIDLGQYFEFENISNEQIINKIKNKFEIINFNKRVSDYLIKKFNLNSDLELYKLLSSKLITITKGKNGARFIYKNKIYDFNLVSKVNVIDSTGAGDAFISSIVNDWIKNKMSFEPNKFETWYLNSNKLTSKVISKMGARGHLKSLYKIKKTDLCTCQNFVLKERKQIKRCNININNLEARVMNALNSKATKKIENINFKKNENYLFIGTGGSYAGAYFASKVINNMYGSNVFTLYPRDAFYRNNKNIDKIILFSYSGTSNDILNSVLDFNNEFKYIITKGEVKKVVIKTNINSDNIISYRSNINKAAERGFLAFEGSLVPAMLFLKYYYNKIDSHFDVNDFIHSSLNYWKNYFDEIFKNKEMIKMFAKGNMINIFRGDNTDSACYDIESKFIESGIVNCIIHEKKNFSHGRFINYENLNNQNNLYFKQKNVGKYEEKLLDYLSSGNNLIIESRYDGLLCEADLLIASQLLIYFIGKKLDVDVSKPKYSDKAMNIYFYNGELY